MKTFFITIMFIVLASMSMAQEDAIAEMESLLAQFVDENEPGVVLYINSAGDEWIAAYGMANLETGQAVAADDLFRIGSITKTFVATIILQLVDEGELSLDDPIADYLPDTIIEDIENADETTIRQMLQMTSGIFSYTESDAFDDAVYENPSYAWSALETIEFIYGEAAYFPTGTDYYYSNSNYNLAQLIIEAITGDSLANQLEDRIFNPLGMSSCYLETPERFAKGIVRGYQLAEDAEGFEDITQTNDGVGLGDGGIVCNAQDLARFLPALLADGALLADDTLDDMLDTVDDGDGGQYGLGIGVEDADFGTAIGHDGATSGFQSTMMYLPDDELTIVILTNNFDSEIVYDLALEVQAAMLDG